jgi:hypothetical protein
MSKPHRKPGKTQAVPVARKAGATKRPAASKPGKSAVRPTPKPAQAARKSPPSQAATQPKAPRPARMQASASDRFVIIMAGGRGERFWPVSREKTPKQLIKLLGDQSFLQQAVQRVLPLVPIENVLIITNAAQVAEVRRQLPTLPTANVIAEPVGRDTCAAVTLGAALVGARSTTGVMAVLPADHVIPEEIEIPASAARTASTSRAAAR